MVLHESSLELLQFILWGIWMSAPNSVPFNRHFTLNQKCQPAVGIIVKVRRPPKSLGHIFWEPWMSVYYFGTNGSSRCVDVSLDNWLFQAAGGARWKVRRSAKSWIHPLGTINIISYISVWTKVADRLTHRLTNRTDRLNDRLTDIAISTALLLAWLKTNRNR